MKENFEKSMFFWTKLYIVFHVFFKNLIQDSESSVNFTTYMFAWDFLQPFFTDNTTIEN